MTLQTVEPVAERILADIQDALGAIRIAHETAPFWNDVFYVYRAQRMQPSIDGYPACVIWLDRNETSDDLEAQEHSLNTESIQIQVDGWLSTSSDVSRALIRLDADIRSALMLDPERGGLAIHTFIGQQRFFNAGEINKPLSRVEVDVTISYRTRVEDLTVSN